MEGGTTRLPNQEQPLSDSTPSLLRRAKNGDRAAQDAVVARHLPRLKRWARGRLPRNARGLEDTDDLLQSAFARTMSRIERVEADQSAGLQGYLRRAVLNRVQDLVRRGRTRPSADHSVGGIADRGPSPLEDLLGRELLECYETALCLLSDLERELVIARLEDGLSFEEIAHELSRPSSDAARVGYTRALRKLAQYMRDAQGKK